MRALVASIATSLSLGAQASTRRPPVDTMRADTIAHQAIVARDSIKTPFATSDVPVLEGVNRIRWGRDQIFRTGAINAAELIAHVPGAAIHRSGFAMAPQVITWFGETGRVRVFLDGVELDVLNPREGTVRDLGAIPVYDLEEVIAESTPAELRVHLRTWRVVRTTPETRVDILTGDLQTNLYRGYFGRRFQSGLGVQFAFEQIGTQQRNIGGDGDGLGMFGRLGWASGDWSVDLTAKRDRRSRDATTESDVSNDLAAFVGSQTTSYLRIAFRNPDSGAVWAQLVAIRDAFVEKTPIGASGITPDSADTNVVRPQYIATAGLTVRGIRASAAARMRHIRGENYLSPSLRVSVDRRRFAVFAFAEHGGHDSTFRADAGFRIAPLVNRIFISGQAAMRGATSAFPDSAGVFERADVGVRVGGLWFSGGVIRRDSVLSRPPVVFADSIADAPTPAVTGETFGVSGAIYKDVGVDVHGVLWGTAGYYRPKLEVAGRIYLESDWRSRFPQGHFTIRASLLAEHHGGYFVPLDSGDVAMIPATPITTMLEIRIKSATLSWQFRNAFGAPYETIPGFRMPSRINLYGVRWNFTN